MSHDYLRDPQKIEKRSFELIRECTDLTSFDIQEAQDMPRFFPNPKTGNVEVEGAIPRDILDGLRAMGHSIVPAPRPIGGSQAISIDHERGTLTGGSDPRKDGCAFGY